MIPVPVLPVGTWKSSWSSDDIGVAVIGPLPDAERRIEPPCGPDLGGFAQRSFP